MKVGTDGVLVGAWADVRPSDRRILDIGTGTGLIALMLAQRAPEAHVTGIDIADVSQARENADASPWGARLAFERCDIRTFVPDSRFDLIVSNPPFFVDSLTCPDAARTTARHTVSLTFEGLRDAVLRLLAPDGRFALILPSAEAARFEVLCRDALSLRRLTAVRTTPCRAPKRMLLEFFLAPSCSLRKPLFELSAASIPPPAPKLSAPAEPASIPAPVLAPICSELVIGTGEHETYTAEYRALTRDFYLKF